jgi:hypothetical protein
MSKDNRSESLTDSRRKNRTALPDLTAELILLKVDVILAAGLLSYAPSYTDSFKRAAVYVDKILRARSPRTSPPCG